MMLYYYYYCHYFISSSNTIIIIIIVCVSDGLVTITKPQGASVTVYMHAERLRIIQILCECVISLIMVLLCSYAKTALLVYGSFLVTYPSTLSMQVGKLRRYSMLSPRRWSGR